MLENKRLTERNSVRGRPLTIIDSMILIGTAAVAISLVKLCDHRYRLWGGWLEPVDTWHERLDNVVFTINVAIICLLMILSPVQLILRLRRPRPRWSRLFREYGTVACLTACCFLPFSIRVPFEWDFEPADFMRRSFYAAFLSEIPMRAPDICGAAVVGAWLTLAVGRSGRRGDAVDLIGCAVGAGWCLTLFAETFLNLSGFFY